MDLTSIPTEHYAFVERLLDVGRRKYHDKHEFHRRMNAGQLGPRAMQLWAYNRFEYQRAIPRKDALILANMPDPATRRSWIQRILDHDGHGEDPGGIDAWLRLVEAVGGTRAEAIDGRHVVPGVRFAVDAYVNFCRLNPWTDAVASSLTELFAPTLHAVRLDAFPKHYPWIDDAGLAYFRKRIGQANADVRIGLDIVLAHFGGTNAGRDRAVQCVEFKCDLLWAQLDAIALACGVGVGPA